MDRKEMLIRIKSECSSGLEYAIALLRFRGFLIEEDKQGYFLSDNSHSKDADYLGSLLREYQLGYLEEIEGNSYLCINNPQNIILFEKEFDERKGIPGDSCNSGFGLSHFKCRKHGYKTPVKELEPGIARYVKAISSAGVITIGCCDGNHPGHDAAYLLFDDAGSAVWHKLIYQRLVANKVDIQWDEKCLGIHFSQDNKYDTYYALNKAAEIIYDNRFLLLDIKEKALKSCTKRFFKHHLDEEVIEIFTRNVNDLFDEELAKRS